MAYKDGADSSQLKPIYDVDDRGAEVAPKGGGLVAKATAAAKGLIAKASGNEGPQDNTSVSPAAAATAGQQSYGGQIFAGQTYPSYAGQQSFGGQSYTGATPLVSAYSSYSTYPSGVVTTAPVGSAAGSSQIASVLPNSTGARNVEAEEYDEEDGEEGEDEEEDEEITKEDKGPPKLKNGPQNRGAMAAKMNVAACSTGCCLMIFGPIFVACLSASYTFVERQSKWEQPLSINCKKTGLDKWGKVLCKDKPCGWDQGGQNLPPNNLTRYLHWDGCSHFKGMKLTDEMANSCGLPCFDSRLVAAMDNFNAKMPWSLVHFSSKSSAPQEQVRLSGYWMPADPKFDKLSPDGKTPVVVLQHGLNANFNSRLVQTYAYMLRSTGFSVFAPNLRDHGSSQKSYHMNRITWGYDYYLDLLGAWECVVNDCEGVFGGTRRPSQVGIAGMSSGTFVAGTVLGMNTSIPGVWLDAPIFEAKWGIFHDVLGAFLDDVWVGWLVNAIIYPAWGMAKLWCGGLNIGLHTPENSIYCPTPSLEKQRVALVFNSEDRDVSPKEARKYAKRLGMYPKCYDLTEFWEATSWCHGSHCSQLFQLPEAYRRKSCKFWSETFGRQEQFCGIDSLPVFTEPPVMAGAGPSTSSSSGTSWQSSWGPGSSAWLSSGSTRIGESMSSSSATSSADNGVPNR